MSPEQIAIVFAVLLTAAAIITAIFTLSLIYIIIAHIIISFVKKCFIKYAHKIIYILTGEFLFKRFSNGGDLAVWRALYTGTIISLFVIFAHFFVYFNIENPLNVIKGNGWQFCGIYAAAYATFYARFVSQWTYLSNLYNQIKEAELNIYDNANNNNEKALDALYRWMAGFIEDAETLHLETKTLFATVILNWSDKYPKIHEFYDGYNPDAIINGNQTKNKLCNLTEKIRKIHKFRK
ncbi:MAG: hypothetical protein IK114_08390 [Fibrobacter sp.]|nr:hypothetical protein [Fibrobacter sp.]